MKNFKPYRLPCPEYDACASDDQGKYGLKYPVFNNTTKIGGLDVVPLLKNSVCGGPIVCTGSYDGTNYASNPCGPWGIYAPVNTFAPDAVATQDFSKCNNVGTVQVCAVRTWHGIYGWLHNEPTCPDVNCYALTMDGQGKLPGAAGYQNTYLDTSYQSAKLLPDQTKYLTLTSVVNYRIDNLNTTYSFIKTQASAGTGNVSINALSGIISSSQSTSENTTYRDTSQPVPITYTTSQVLNGVGDYWDINGVFIRHDSSGAPTEIDSSMGADVHCSGVTMPPSFIAIELEGVVDSWNANVRNRHAQYIVPEGELMPEKTYATYAGAAKVEQIDPPNGVVGNGSYLSVSWTRSATAYTFDITYTTRMRNSDTGAILSERTQHFWGTLTLSAPVPANGAGSIGMDLAGLLANWNLTDRVLMPLSTAGFDGSMVKVSRQENPNAQSPIGFFPYGYTDPNSSLYTGVVLGAPLALAVGGQSPSNYFDAAFENWQACSPSGVDWRAWGGWRSQFPNLPPRATQWTNLVEAFNGYRGSYLTIGAWTLCGSTSPDGRVWMSKWAESAVNLPSYDHSRPSGADRAVIDQTTRLCVSDVLTPGTLRFPNCPPFSGRLRVASVVNNLDGTCTVVTEAAPLKIDGSNSGGTVYRIQFCAIGMVAIAGATSLLPVATDASTFKVTVAYAAIAAATWVVLQGALVGDTPVTGVAHWYWGDTEGKGNCVVLSWQSDNRTGGERTRLTGVMNCAGSQVTLPAANYGYASATITDDCKGYVACAPWLLVLSPNASDAPLAGQGSLWLITGGNLDERYGSRNISVFSQAMLDPLYQSPPPPCGDWTPPVSPCLPYVEARSQLPYYGSAVVPPDNGAGMAQNEAPPTPPVSYVMLSAVAYTVGNVEYPPTYGSQPIHYYIPTGKFEGGCP